MQISCAGRLPAGLHENAKQGMCVHCEEEDCVCMDWELLRGAPSYTGSVSCVVGPPPQTSKRVNGSLVAPLFLKFVYGGCVVFAAPNLFSLLLDVLLSLSQNCCEA